MSLIETWESCLLGEQSQSSSATLASKYFVESGGHSPSLLSASLSFTNRCPQECLDLITLICKHYLPTCIGASHDALTNQVLDILAKAMRTEEVFLQTLSLSQLLSIHDSLRAMSQQFARGCIVALQRLGGSDCESKYCKLSSLVSESFRGPILKICLHLVNLMTQAVLFSCSNEILMIQTSTTCISVLIRFMTLETGNGCWTTSLLSYRFGLLLTRLVHSFQIAPRLLMLWFPF